MLRTEIVNLKSSIKNPQPTFADAFRFWLKLGFISFGGPAGQIAIMHTELVERRKWIDESRFLHALNYCMLLPGPEATQLATYIGWLLHRTWGGVVAGALFVIPSIFILWGLSVIYVTFGTVPWVAAIFYGLKPAVLAIVAAAVIRIGRRALKNEVMWTLAALAFVALYFFHVPFPIIVFSAGVIGFLGGKFWRAKFPVAQEAVEPPLVNREHTKPSWRRAGKVLAICLALWLGPLLFVGWWLGWEHSIARQGVFFSKAAMVTFGGAYAVLPYVSQQAVEHYQWLGPGEMLDGLGLAGMAGFLLAAAAVAIGLGLRRPRRMGAVLAVVFLVVFAFEAGLHSAHHLGDPLRAAACTVAVATAHLAAAPLDAVSIEPPNAPVLRAGRSAEPTPVTLHPPASHDSRAPPALTA